MLRDTSTRIGNRLLFAAAGGTITIGRSRIRISSDERQRAKRAETDVAGLRSACTGTRA